MYINNHNGQIIPNQVCFYYFPYYLIKEKQIENIQDIYAFDELHFLVLAH